MPFFDAAMHKKKILPRYQIYLLLFNLFALYFANDMKINELIFLDVKYSKSLIYIMK